LKVLICGFHRGFAEDLCPLGYYAVSTGKQITTCRRILRPKSSVSSSTKRGHDGTWHNDLQV